MILPSLNKKGLDRDLKLKQQTRKIRKDLKDIRKTIELCKKEERRSFSANVAGYTHVQQKWKRNYIKKFNHLYKKQRQDIYRAGSKRSRKNKKDYKRYINRKRLKKAKEEEMLAKDAILNKSNVNLEDRHKVLLYKGLNFVPTPKWNEPTKNQEWLNLERHLRSCEWSSVFQEESNNPSYQVPEKLKIPKFNRPEPKLVEEKTKVYCEMARSKLRNLQNKVNFNYYKRCNLDCDQKKALDELKQWIKNNEIVICKADKDGRVLVVNYGDYQTIMDRELKKFNHLQHLNPNNVNCYFDDTRNYIKNQLVNLHKEEVVDDEMLLLVSGMKSKNKTYYKVTGSKAKYFACNEAAYSYPLFKTHKINQSLLHQVNILEIPTRLLQAAGNITTSRTTAFLEMVLQPISIKFCSYKVDEYCRDSKSYLENLDAWKKNKWDEHNNEKLYLIAADVQALYPSIRRELVRDGVRQALQLCSDYSQNVIDILVNLTMFCLENVIVRHGDRFYNQVEGIITGDNHSVSVANIALHHILLGISDQLNSTCIFKRYIDDIMTICSSETQAIATQEALKQKFEESGLKLTFRTIQTGEPNSCVEFLDVNHVTDCGSLGGFYTTNYIKPTAQNRTFLNGRSYHPSSTFRSIVFSESIRLRRLNERHDMYLQAIENLKTKCLKSGFKKETVERMTNIAKTWTERFQPPRTKQNKKRIVWATSFPALLRISKMELALNETAQITYKRPQTLGQQLTRYRALAHGLSNDRMASNVGSGPCGRCSLCGNHGQAANMVACSRHIKINGKEFEIRQSLNCSDWGIYAAVCKVCGEAYVGQTATSFSKRFNSHRHIWKKGCKEISDQAALRVHFDTKHQQAKEKPLPQAFVVYFLEKPNIRSLDVRESLWINRLQAKINISPTILPRYM